MSPGRRLCVLWWLQWKPGQCSNCHGLRLRCSSSIYHVHSKRGQRHTAGRALHVSASVWTLQTSGLRHETALLIFICVRWQQVTSWKRCKTKVINQVAARWDAMTKKIRRMMHENLSRFMTNSLFTHREKYVVYAFLSSDFKAVCMRGYVL